MSGALPLPSLPVPTSTSVNSPHATEVAPTTAETLRLISLVTVISSSLPPQAVNKKAVSAKEILRKVINRSIYISHQAGKKVALEWCEE